MDQLLARLTNFSYELFGVFVPGAIALLFATAWWGAIGPLAAQWTDGWAPALTVAGIGEWINSLNSALGIGIGIPLFIASYFVGHFLLWASRSGGALGTGGALQRACKTLTFRIQRPKDSYDTKLQPLLEKVLGRLSAEGMPPFSWRQAYPIIKCFLAETGKFSLLTNYQNKYTLHRSIAFASVVLVWISVLAIIAALVTACLTQTQPKVIGLILLSVFGIVLALGFASSYRFYWQMWGNVAITESYSHLFGPQCQTKSTS